MMEQYIKRTTNSRGIRLFVGALLLTVPLLLSIILVPATSHAKAMAKEIEVLAPEDTLGTTGPAQAEDEGSAAEHVSIGTSSPIETPEDNPDIPNNHIEGMYLHAIDLGNTSCGDAVIVASEHDILLMDLGNQSTFERIREALDELGAPRHSTYSNMRLSLYFSHYHSDHTGGLKEGDTLRQILDTYAISAAYLPDYSVFGGRISDESAYVTRGDRIASLASSQNNNLNIVRLKAGSSFQVGLVQANVIGPVGINGFSDPGTEPQNSEDDSNVGPWNDFVNNCSLVTRFTYGNTSFLSTGDATDEAEQALVAAYGDDLKTDVLKMAHHALSGNTEEFLAHVRPQYTFATNNSFVGMRPYSTSGKNVRKTYTMKQRASAYGLCYMIGEEQDGFVVMSDGTSKLCYRHSDQDAPLAGGIVRTVGSYGENRGGGDLDLYDYYYLDDEGFPIAGFHTTTIDGVEGPRLFGSGGLLAIGDWGYNANRKYVFKGWHEYTNGRQQFVYQDTALLASGFQQIDGSTYYFSATKDYCRVTGSQKIKGSYYLFNESGKMLKSCWNNNRYFGADGKRLSGLNTINGKIYYLDPKTGCRTYGLKKIGGKYYCFREESGTAYANMSKKFDGYVCKFDKNGVWTNVPKPATPKLTSITAPAKKKLKIVWQQQNDVDGYEVYMATSKKGTYKKVATKKGATTTQYTASSLASKKTMYFKIRSYKTVLGHKWYSSFSNVLGKQVR